MARPAQRHLRWLLGLGAVGLVLTAAANVLVNPWRVLPQSSEIKALDPYREIDAEIRTCKAGLAMRGSWNVVILGSSRPNKGFDPSRPGFGGQATVNLGLDGGDLFETRAMLDHALKFQRPERAILLLDPGDLTRIGKLPIESDFEFSPLATGDPVERSLRYVFSQRAVDASVASLSLAAKKKAPAYTPLGLHLKKPPRLNYFETMETYYLPLAVQLTEIQKRGLGIQSDKLAVVRSMLDACASRGVKAILAIPPNHLTLCQAMEEKGSPDPWFLAERRALAELVKESNSAHPQQPCEFWDLNLPSPITTEPFPPRDASRAMENWLDPIHFTPAAGDRYAALLLGTRSEDKTLGHHVDPRNPEVYLAEVERLFKDAATKLPDERDGIRKALEKR